MCVKAEGAIPGVHPSAASVHPVRVAAPPDHAVNPADAVRVDDRAAVVGVHPVEKHRPGPEADQLLPLVDLSATIPLPS